MKRLNIYKHLKKHKHYATLARAELDHIGREIQKYIDWDNDITIEEDPIGFWVSNAVEELVPLYTVIEIIEEKGVLSEHDYNSNKI